MFLEIELEQNGETYSWGFYSESIPQVGTSLYLGLYEPDVPTEKSNFTHIECRVTEVLWCLEGDTVWVTVESDTKVVDDDDDDERLVPDSEAWPASEYSKRKAQLRKDIEQIRRTGRVN